MVDITHKSNTLRIAVAEAVVKVSSSDTIAAIKNKTVPKGDVLEAARTAGLFGVKRTWEMIPDCHPLPVEYTHIDYEIKDNHIRIEMEVKTVYKTGVEVEAMHGVSVVALTMYDMLKPIDKGVSIQNIRLLNKQGGKSDLKNRIPKNLKACVAVCSDPIQTGNKGDEVGQQIIERLKKQHIEVAHYGVSDQSQRSVEQAFADNMKHHPDVLIIAGGTGLTPNDKTPDYIAPLLDREVPGIMEAARSYGLNRTPLAMLSRGLAGIKNQTLVLVIPGSVRGASETLDALLPNALNALVPMRKEA